jgi:hypothetical protein
MARKGRPRMDLVVPFLSSSAVGPLGVCHLPRMWLKVLLYAQGRLPAGYRHGTGGFDEATALNLGFDRDAFIDFVTTKLPTYLECEAWVRAHAKNLDPESIRKHNALVHRDKPPLMAKAQRAFVGLADESVLDATLLNDLDDWQTVHALVTKGSLPPLQLSSFNAEMTEVLRTVLDAGNANRVAIHVDLPSLGADSSKPAAEAKRMIDGDGELAKTNVAHNGEQVGWIAVYGAGPWNGAAAKALERAAARAGEILDEISLSAVARN